MDDTIRVELKGEVWIKGKELSIEVPCLYYFVKNGITMPRTVENLTDGVLAHYLDVMDRRSHPFLEFEDEKYGKTIIAKEHVLALKIHPPVEFPKDIQDYLDEWDSENITEDDDDDG